MGVQVRTGHGNVYQGNDTTPSGTYVSAGGTITYDDNPQGSGGNDKTLHWDITHQGYYIGPSWSTASAHVFYEEGTEDADGHKTYTWQEYAGDPIPATPTKNGRQTETS